MTTRAVVLGGGGEAGVAWEVGLLWGLLEQDVDLREADEVIGTSAGAIVGALLLGGTDLAELYAQQIEPLSAGQVLVGGPGDVDAAAMMAAYRRALTGATTEQDARIRLGRLALQSARTVEPGWRSRIARRIGTAVWPSTRLVIVAIMSPTARRTCSTTGRVRRCPMRWRPVQRRR